LVFYLNHEFLCITFPVLESFVYCFMSPEILSSTWSTVQGWLSSVLFIWLKEVYISRISVWFFFLKFSICLLNASFLSSLFHITFS
jgi:hypothetical protein